MKELTSENFDKEVLMTPGIVLIDFFATWCGPCKSMVPLLEQLDSSRQDLTVFKVDIDKSQDLAQRFKVSSVPTFKFIKSGRVLKTQVGMMNPNDLDNILNSLT
jgi:thioredoxin 1